MALSMSEKDRSERQHISRWLSGLSDEIRESRCLNGTSSALATDRALGYVLEQIEKIKAEVQRQLLDTTEKCSCASHPNPDEVCEDCVEANAYRPDEGEDEELQEPVTWFDVLNNIPPGVMVMIEGARQENRP